MLLLGFIALSLFFVAPARSLPLVTLQGCGSTPAVTASVGNWAGYCSGPELFSATGQTATSYVTNCTVGGNATVQVFTASTNCSGTPAAVVHYPLTCTNGYDYFCADLDPADAIRYTIYIDILPYPQNPQGTTCGDKGTSVSNIFTLNTCAFFSGSALVPNSLSRRRQATRRLRSTRRTPCTGRTQSRCRTAMSRRRGFRCAEPHLRIAHSLAPMAASWRAESSNTCETSLEPSPTVTTYESGTCYDGPACASSLFAGRRWLTALQVPVLWRRAPAVGLCLE